MRADIRKSAILKRKVYSHVFDSLGDMLDASMLPAHECQDSYLRDMLQNRAGGDDWTYGKLQNAERYLSTMRDGWLDAVSRIEKLSASISGAMATPVDMRRKVRRGPTGDEFDIHASRAGAFDKAWTARRKTVARAPAPIRIICGVVYNASYNPESFFWRGACALSLASGLRRKGYRVAVSGVGALIGLLAHAPANYVARFDALQYGEALDTARLASILCTSATLRHVLFRTALLLPEQVGGGFGHAARGKNELETNALESGAFPTRNEERIVIGDHVSDERAATAWLAEVSARFA